MNNQEVANWLERDVAPTMLGYFHDLLTTFKLAQDVLERNVPGDLIECGVFAGAHCAAIGKAILLSGQTNRKLHLFDSFQGVPQCGPEDEEFVAANVQPGGASCPMSSVQMNMTRWGIPSEICVYHPGWFSETVPVANIDQIALLRLDGDLYSSTKECIEILYPKVSTNGWIIVDDWHLTGCRKALHETMGYPRPGYFQMTEPTRPTNQPYKVS